MLTPSRGLRPHSWYVYTTAVLFVSILAWATGMPTFFLRVEAAQLDTFSDTLSTSAPGAASNHTLLFDTPSGVAADGSTIEISVPSGFDMSFIGEDDVDIEDDGADLTTGTACGAVQAAISTSSQTITIEICSGGGGAIAAASTVTIEVGANATASGTGGNQITNHTSEGSYVLSVGGTMADGGDTHLVIVETVDVTGAVDTYFLFTINGVDAEVTVNNDATQTTGTTTATTAPFGIVVPGTEYVLAQNLAVTTNAADGFTVTVQASGDLEASSGATIDSFTDGTEAASPGIWAAPSADVLDTDSYGHWGITTEDRTLTDDNSFGDALYVGNFITEPREVMYSTSSADGTTAHIGATRVGYKMEITNMQEAATDYTTTLTYVATPTF